MWQLLPRFAVSHTPMQLRPYSISQQDRILVQEEVLQG